MMRPTISAQYDELARLYGCEAVWNCMDEVSRLDDDDEVTPEDRLARVRAAFADGAHVGGLKASLAEVKACLAAGPGEHRDLLERLRARLEAALQ